ncbi:MAG: TIM barrel protein [Clostridia bacterium]
MENRIRFGPSGNSESFYGQGNDSTLQMPMWIHGMGLDAFEYSFGRGVRLGEDKAREIALEAQKYDVQLSVHMPYFINLAVEDPEKRDKNIGYFMDSLKVACALGAKRAVFHPGSATGGEREDILVRAKAFLKDIIAQLDAAGFGGITLCAETMGKINQLGSLEEVIELCAVDERLLPAVDFGHLHTRGLGAINSKQDYADILDKLENGIGRERTSVMHVHFSRIEFTKGGEKMHHTFKDTQYGPEFFPLGELIAERGYTPVLICESKGTMAEDAVEMRKMYQQSINCLFNHA